MPLKTRKLQADGPQKVMQAQLVCISNACLAVLVPHGGAFSTVRIFQSVKIVARSMEP